MTLHKAPIRCSVWNRLENRKRVFTPSLARRSSALASSQTGIESSENNHEFFEYTSGRWLYNEPLRLSERRLKFNIPNLLTAAAASVDKPVADIKSIRKFAEGGFNRIFDISMRDGSSIVARLPYPSTVPRRWAVASEVATLAFVRAHGVPAPRVLGYSCGDVAGEDGVGAEYIFMEKLPGKRLGDTWFDLSEQERLKVLLQVVELETKLFNINLPGSGSIYHARDLSPDTPRMEIDIPGSVEDGLCIGPYAALRWWFGERGDLDIDRGPHTDPCLVLQAPAQKELSWLRAYGRPRFPFERAYRETFDYKKQDPEEHVASLVEYIQLAPHLVPTSSKLNQPVLRHPDLQPNNILVSDDLSITGLIDWQHSMVLPAFLAAGMPNAFENYGDEESMSFIPPQLPHDLESMDTDDQARVREQFRRRHVHFFYLGFTQRLNEPHWRALEHDTGLLKRRIFNDAGSPWEGWNTPLQIDIVRVAQNWSQIASADPDGTVPTCPIVLGEEEVQRRTALDESLREMDEELERINGYLGVASDGWTPNELFESAKERARLIKEEGLAAVSDDPWLREMTEQNWPFDDWDEDE
ncbi:kinase-like protein [Byssothecium circinans]|uniref:Kinase-like protein n=1 Tax=Byssothecium circinans TaxID=147558 RepID=A0A6A5UGN4_9PLEO|nr:kinase-like protein [Byssothecium circinans]